ncbi:MAG: NOL1/NOP2/sun family putative RNA methylase [Nanoarchaeota archaeon]|nr:NOL1/NOP2/sun family putative RNA methylase [Nanoarchaeota archaeon]
MNFKYKPKPYFKERIESLLENKQDIKQFWEISKKGIQKSIRCNTLKISIENLKEKLESKGWKINQPFNEFPEIMIIENNLNPGELGRAIEHLLGYYYVQEIASMMPPLALNPKPGEIILDLCSSPGSKTTQMSSMMENQGTIIANDNKLGRISILNTNLERCGVSNTIITRNDGVQLCKRLESINMKFDKILTDVPCSGEGNLRSSPKTLQMWNPKVIKILSKQQQKLASSALKLLKVGGTMIYSTCTHSPEENEQVLQHLKENFNIEIEKISLPIKCRPGLTEWEKPSMKKEEKENNTLNELNDHQMLGDNKTLRKGVGSSEYNKKDNDDNFSSHKRGGREFTRGDKNRPTSEGSSWEGFYDEKKNITFDQEIKNACRIWPQDNNTEGFFLAKIRRLG